MVKQGSIIKISFNPQLGHEQAGYRPAVVISNDVFNEKSSMTLVCPITNSASHFPLHVSLDERLQTTGEVMCEQIKAVDLRVRAYQFVEQMPSDLLQRIIRTVYAEIEILE